MANTTSAKCSNCGAEIPVRATGGVCARCAAAFLQASQTEMPEEAGADPDRAPAAQTPLPPEQIGPHFPQLEILEYLGRGGMGVVYKARQKSLNRLVVLKLLAPERIGDAKFAERFAHEARALAALNHPNIVTIHDFGQAGGFYFLLMEFVDGVNLRQLLRARKFTPEEALAIVPSLCDALQFAHERGIVHRDIKPENLLLDKNGRVKVVDFGIAKMMGGGNGGEGGEATPRNATQAAVGTAGYSAPEQKTDPGRVDSRADIYSLGVVFYEMLTGELPGKPLEAPSKKVHIDVRLDEVVLRALEQKPELRYGQVSEVKTMVETIAGGGHIAGKTAKDLPADATALRSCDCYISSPERLRGFWGNLYIYDGKGTIQLNAAELVFFDGEGAIRIPLRAIRNLHIGHYPRLAKPARLDYISVTYEQAGTFRTHFFTPAWTGFAAVWTTNRIVNEWFYALKASVLKAQGGAAESETAKPGFDPLKPHSLFGKYVPPQPPQNWFSRLVGRFLSPPAVALIVIGVIFTNLIVLWKSNHVPEWVWTVNPLDASASRDYGEALIHLIDVSQRGQVVVVKLSCDTPYPERGLYVQYSGQVFDYPANIVSLATNMDCLVGPRFMSGTDKVLAGSTMLKGKQIYQIGFVLPDPATAAKVVEEVRATELGKPMSVTEARPGLMLFTLHQNVGKDANGVPVTEGLSAQLVWQSKSEQKDNGEPSSTTMRSFGPVISRAVNLGSPNALSEAPKLQFLAWRDEWETKPASAARHPDGSPVTNDTELKWIAAVQPGFQDARSPFLCLWFSHPAYDGDSLNEVTLLDGQNKVVPLTPNSTSYQSEQNGNDHNGNLGWCVTGLSPGAGANVPHRVTVRLRFTVGPLERTDEIAVTPHMQTSMSFEGNGELNAVGQNVDGQAFVSISINSTNDMNARCFGVMAVTKDGRKLMKGGSRVEGIEPSILEFDFNVPLSDVAKFIIGTHPIRTVEWKDVVLPGMAESAVGLVPGQPAFGPVIERVVGDAIDLGSGRTGTMPLDGLGKSGLEAFLSNTKGIEREGWDIIMDNPETIYGIGMKAVPLAATTWDTLTAHETVDQLQAALVQAFVQFSPDELFPATYVFQTRKGGMGILQITGFTKDRHGMRVRYRLVQNAAVKTDKVPDAETTAELKPVPQKTAELWNAWMAEANSYLAAHDMKNTNVQAAFSKLSLARTAKIEEMLKGTVVEPLVKQQDELKAELQMAARAGNKENVPNLVEEMRTVGKQIERTINHRPTFQLRWLAADSDTNLPVEDLPGVNALDGERTFRVLKRVALNEYEVKSAGFTDYQSDKKDLSVILFPRSGVRFSTDAGQHLGRSLALISDGCVIRVFDSWRTSDGEAIFLIKNCSDAEGQTLLDLLNHRAKAEPDITSNGIRSNLPPTDEPTSNDPIIRRLVRLRAAAEETSTNDSAALIPIAFCGQEWLPWRTLFEVRGDKLASLPQPRPGFNYGHDGGGRGPQLFSNIGNQQWKNYRAEFEYCVTGVDPAFHPYEVPPDYHDGEIYFHVADAKENWNARGLSAYILGIGGNGSWFLRCTYNDYCAAPAGFGSPRNDGGRKLTGGTGLKIDRVNGNKYVIEVKGQRIQIWVDDEKIADVVDDKMGETIGGQTLDHGGIGFIWGYDAMGWIRNFSLSNLNTNWNGQQYNKMAPTDAEAEIIARLRAKRTQGDAQSEQPTQSNSTPELPTAPKTP